MSQEYIITIAENHKLSLDIAVKRANNWDFRKIIGGTKQMKGIKLDQNLDLIYPQMKFHRNFG